MVRDKLTDTGYDREEEYFKRQEREELAKRRAELDAQRKEQEAGALKEQHWMRCPKCGHRLEEVELEAIKVDRCTNCRGVFFDAGEVELLLSQRDSGGLLSGMKKWFGGE